MSLQFTDVCFITDDVLRLRTFYEVIFDVKAEGDEIHSYSMRPDLVSPYIIRQKR